MQSIHDLEQVVCFFTAACYVFFMVRICDLKLLRGKSFPQVQSAMALVKGVSLSRDASSQKQAKVYSSFY